MKPLVSELFPMRLYFCDDESGYAKAAKMTGCDTFDQDDAQFNSFPAPGNAHTIAVEGDNGLEIVVALGEQDSEDLAVSVIIHESVHVWQFPKKSIREKHPGIETEAYAIQYYARWMIEQYKKNEAKRMKAAKDKEFNEIIEVIKKI